MQARLLLSAALMAVLVLAAIAQDFRGIPETQEQHTAPAPQQVKPPKPPKPKPAAAPKSPWPYPCLWWPRPRSWLAQRRNSSIKLATGLSSFTMKPGGYVRFAASSPSDMQPKTATSKRTPVVFYATAWQKDGVRGEVSVKLGYAVKPKSVATVTAADKLLPAGGRRQSLRQGCG